MPTENANENTNNNTKDYAKMDLAMALRDIHDKSGDILVGVSIPHRHMGAFVQDVLALADKYEGATFEELLENDADDASLEACIARRCRLTADDVVEQASNILSDAIE